MADYQVKFSRRANQDVADILNWLRQRSVQGARRWLEALEQIETRLRASPEGFGLAEESDTFKEPVRQALFRTKHGNTYRVLFVVREDTVTLLCVRGPGQPPFKPSDMTANN